MKKRFSLMPSFFLHLSLQAKITLILLFTVSLPVMVIAAYSYNKATTSYENTALALNHEHLQKATSSIRASLDTIPHDLTFIKESYDLNRYFQWYAIGETQEAHRWLTTTINGLYSFMSTKTRYMQLRIIDTKGQEVIRINRAPDSQLSISHKTDLRHLSESETFIEAMKLSTETYSISKVRLNRVQGKAQQPHTPVMHYALPIIDQNGTRHGIIALKVFADSFLYKTSQRVKTDAQKNDAIFITNKDGFYLSHPNPNKTFGFDLGNDENLMHDDPALWKALQEGTASPLMTSDTLYTFEKFYPHTLTKEQYWYVIHAVSRDEVLADLSAFQQTFFAIILSLFVLLFLLSRPLIRKLVQPLHQVTANLQRLQHGKTELQSITYDAHDEIRDMVDAAKGMGHRILEAISQANAIAQGDFRKEITPLSEKDELAIALNTMTTTLQEVTSIAQSVAEGDLGKTVHIKGRHDLLGLSLKEMVRMLRKTVKHANNIAQGDFHADIEPRSDKDTLNIALRDMTQTLRGIAQVATALSKGDYDVDINVKSDKDQLGKALINMTQSLQQADIDHKEQDWFNTNRLKINQSIQESRQLSILADALLPPLTDSIHAVQAAFFVWHDNHEQLQLAGSYAQQAGATFNAKVKLGQGLVGQCAKGRQLMQVKDIPDDYLKITSGLGDTQPCLLVLIPLTIQDTLYGVIELALLKPLSSLQEDFLIQIAPSIAINVRSIQFLLHTEQLLEESQSLAEELQSQEEELQAQTEELRESNETLVEKNRLVETQKMGLEEATEAIKLKAKEIQQASHYKSEFLANMSHELRTPLNSLLILSDMLAKNKDENLTDRQVEFARTIHNSGEDLLELINDILDLAKVEAGKMSVELQPTQMHEITDPMERYFRHVAHSNEVDFRIELADGAPKKFITDAMRLKQILKNLLSNAFKFTEQGAVVLEIQPQGEHHINFSVRDSGTGIAADKLESIFQAFQQEDGSTSRKYGGTGLGLSLSRELANLLDGALSVNSQKGKGSTFTLTLPLEHSTATSDSATAQITPVTLPQNTDRTTASIEPDQLPVAATLPNTLHDDRDTLDASKKTVLIIEDDPSFAKILQDVVRETGFQAVNALQGDHGLALTHQLIPDAILLDLQLPVLDGQRILDHIKHHPKTRHIPVHVISCMDEDAAKQVLQSGALSFMNKPVNEAQLHQALDSLHAFINREVKRLLIVENELEQQQALQDLLANDELEILTAHTAAEALEILQAQTVDCMLLDLMLPDMPGEALLEKVAKGSQRYNQGHPLPVIIHTGKDLSEEEVEQLQGKVSSIIIKGSHATERLLSETSMFLNQIEASLPYKQQEQIDQARQQDTDLHGKVVLLADDDIRNIFSLSSLLEEQGMVLHTARNGKEALDALAAHANDINLVLMDIMMPEMDGYEAMQAIRQIEQHKNLPIIALTAKAMKGDREKSIQAGASDYITKPIDTTKLLSLLRVWLYESDD